MIPVLYHHNETQFRTMGIGALTDAFDCFVKQKLNGYYELEFKYPVGGYHYDDIALYNIVLAVPEEGKAPQPFDITGISKPINHVITVTCEHVSQRLSFIPVMPFQAENCADALLGIKANAVGTCPFDFWTDKSVTAPYRQKKPYSIRERLGGVEGSVLDVYGGQYEFDVWTVKLFTHRGEDRHVHITYGKNITDFTQEENLEKTVTGIIPYYYDEESDTLVTLPEGIIYCENADRYPQKRAVPYDFTQHFTDEAPTVDELRSIAETYVEANITGEPDVSISVSFLPLSGTEEYRQLTSERVNLGDIVYVDFPNLGVSARSTVSAYEWDVLNERYKSVEIGTYRSTLSSTIAKINKTLKEQDDTAVKRSDLTIALDHQRDLLAGGSGGNVVFRYENGVIREVIAGNTDNISTMQHCVVMNSAGIGVSDGYGATPKIAITNDGTINAEMIGAGAIKSYMIEAEAIAVTQLHKDLQGLYEQVKVLPDGVHVMSSTNDGTMVTTAEAVMQSDGLHILYGGRELAKFTTLEAFVKSLRVEELSVGVHRIKRRKLKRMSNGQEDWCTTFDADGGIDV